MVGWIVLHFTNDEVQYQTLCDVSKISRATATLPTCGMWMIPLRDPDSREALTWVRGQALALVGGDVVRLEVSVDGVVLEGAHHLLDCVRYEDEGDEAGEALLCEARHVLDDVAGVSSYQDKTLQAGMHADPQTQLHVIYAVISLGGRSQYRVVNALVKMHLCTYIACILK